MPEGVKRIIVDGASTVNSVRSLGVEFIDYHGLLTVLRGKVGQFRSCNEEAPPAVTLHPDFCCKHAGGVYDTLVSSGWQVYPAESYNGNDDRIVSDLIEKCSQIPWAIEIVLATSDHELIEDLFQVVAKRIQQGLVTRSFVFATCRHNPDDHCRICSSTLKQMPAHGVYFVEMADFLNEITCNMRHR
jgi:hypothetical protein